MRRRLRLMWLPSKTQVRRAGLINQGKIRKGYEFTAEFISNGEVRLDTWIALEGTVNILTKTIAELKDAALGSDKVIIAEEKSLTGSDLAKVTINISGPITLVPLCTDQPQIDRTIPYLYREGDEEAVPAWPNNLDFTVYFASRLDSTTVDFGEDAISITMQDSDDQGNTSGSPENAAQYFKKPRWDNAQRAIIIEPGTTLPPENKLFTLTLGTEIKSSLFSTPLEPAVSYSWISSSSVDSVSLQSWNANYLKTGGDMGPIYVNWSYEGSPPPQIRAYYRIDGGMRIDVDVNAKEKKLETPSLYPVSSNSAVTGAIEKAKRYDVYLEYISGDRVFKVEGPISMWNVPGMDLTNTNTVLLNNESMDNIKILLDTKNYGEKNFILTGNLDTKSEDGWEPVGDFDFPFKGNFYGNGNRINVSGFADKEYTGIFGYTDGAVIRDLHVFDSGGFDLYNAVYAGGIVGYAAGTSISNCIVESNQIGDGIRITSSITEDIFIGGIAGYIDQSTSKNGSLFPGGAGAIIENCYAKLSVSYTSNGHIKDVSIGAVAGFAGMGTRQSQAYNSYFSIGYEDIFGLIINNVTINAYVRASKDPYAGIPNTGNMYVGGAVGKSSGTGDIFSQGNAMQNVIFANGRIELNGSESTNYCGGLVGYADSTSFDNCTFAGEIGMSSLGEDNVINTPVIGGLVGKYNVQLNSNNVYFNKCQYNGNITIKYTDGITFGGLIGSIDNNSINDLYMLNSLFNGGTITLTGSGDSYAGGVIGTKEGSKNILNNCGSLGGSLSLTVADEGEIHAGGFISSNSGSISHCFAKMDVFITRESTSYIRVHHYAGGFVGFNEGEIEACYASGSIQVVDNDGTFGTPDYYDYTFINIGGFVGHSSGTIENCYALGNVLVDKQSGIIPPVGGGFAGFIYEGTLQYCFSEGQVAVHHTLYTSGTHDCLAGGIAAYLTYGETFHFIIDEQTQMIKTKIAEMYYCAALGNKVITTNSYNAHRVYSLGNYQYIPEWAINYNYAIETMLVGSGDYGDYVSGKPLTDETHCQPEKLDGASISESDARDQQFWEKVLKFDFSGSSSVWVFERGRRYPVLRGVLGQ